MKHIDLFSGIGGFALAVDTVWPGSEHIFCDTEPFSQQILKKHWPNSKIYGDIRTITDPNRHGFQEQEARKQAKRQGGQNTGGRDNKIDILTGGFPCQPFSAAGLRKGTEDNRYLWPEMFRIIRTFKPTWVIAENVRGLVTWNDGLVLEQVCADLESQGYEVQPFIIPAVAVNAPHRRDRIWFIAHRQAEGLERSNPKGPKGTARRPAEYGGDAPNTADNGSNWRPAAERRQKQDQQQRQTLRDKFAGKNPWPDWDANWLEVAAELCGMDDGVSPRVDEFAGHTKAGHRTARLKALGNAIVPQVAIQIMQAIKATQTK